MRALGRLLLLLLTALWGVGAPALARAQGLTTGAFDAALAQRGAKQLLRALRTAPAGADGAALLVALGERDGLFTEPAVAELLEAARTHEVDWSSPYLLERPQLVSVLRAVESLPDAELPLHLAPIGAVDRLAGDCAFVMPVPGLVPLAELAESLVGAPPIAAGEAVEIFIAPEAKITPELPDFGDLPPNRLLADLRAYVTHAHTSMSTSAARALMYEMTTDGRGFVIDVYRGRRALTPGFPDIGDINVDHIWPTSRSKGWYARSTSASKMFSGDLHNQLPVDATWNARRGNLPFGEVGPGPAKYPRIRNGVFEPPDSQKGRIARIMFYDALRYGLDIPEDMEAMLRRWHQRFGVDDYERARNNLIQQLQGNRNPFIDAPDLVAQIPRFAGIPAPAPWH